MEGFHDVDSSEMAFKLAGSMCFREGARKANPVILETTVCKVEVEFSRGVHGRMSSGDHLRRREVGTGLQDSEVV